jgi:hypothetical protein
MRHPHNASLSAVPLLSSLELDIAVHMYQKLILDDMLSKEHRLVADISFLA